MEINYNKFNEWDNVRGFLAERDPMIIIGEENLATYLEGTIPAITEEDAIKIDQRNEELTDLTDLMAAVIEEIDLNIVALVNKERILSYLNYIKKRHLGLINTAKSHLNYHWFRQSIIHFDEYEECTAEEVGYTPSKVKRWVRPTEVLKYIKPGYGVAFEEDGTLGAFTKRVYNDAISKYLTSCFGTLQAFDQVQGHIQDAITEHMDDVLTINTETIDIAHEDLYKDWREVIAEPQRRIKWDFWTEKFRSVRKRIDEKIDLINKINNENTQLGSGDQEADEFIKFATDIFAVLPDQIFKHELIVEIEKNIVDFKSKTERNRYLEVIESTLTSLINDYNYLCKSHPDYGSQRHIDWRIIRRDRDKYTLNRMYVQCLVVAHVLKQVRAVVFELLNPTLLLEAPRQPDALNRAEQKPLFRNPDDQQKYIDILKKAKPAILNEKGEFILGVKSKTKYPVTAWFDALDRKGLINPDLQNDNDRAAAINFIIPNLHITGRSLGTPAAGHNDKYTYFLSVIN